MKKDEQPKDYVIQSFEEALDEAYQSLSLFQKILYHLQENLILVIIASIGVGYLAGTNLGKFW